jgi:hypothetical protein
MVNSLPRLAIWPSVIMTILRDIPREFKNTEDRLFPHPTQAELAVPAAVTSNAITKVALSN